MTAEYGVIKPVMVVITTHDRKLELKLKNGHLMAENDGLTLENWGFYSELLRHYQLLC